MIKIRRLWDCLIYKMGIPILVRQHFYIESGPSSREAVDIEGLVQERCNSIALAEVQFYLNQLKFVQHPAQCWLQVFSRMIQCNFCIGIGMIQCSFCTRTEQLMLSSYQLALTVTINRKFQANYQLQYILMIWYLMNAHICVFACSKHNNAQHPFSNQNAVLSASLLYVQLLNSLGLGDEAMI